MLEAPTNRPQWVRMYGLAVVCVLSVGVIVADAPDNAAVMADVPLATPAAKPVESMVSTTVVAERHDAILDTFWLLRSEYVAVAVNCFVETVKTVGLAKRS